MKSYKPFPAINEFNNLLSKPENKVHLQTFLDDEFQKMTQVSNIEIIYTVVEE